MLLKEMKCNMSKQEIIQQYLVARLPEKHNLHKLQVI